MLTKVDCCPNCLEPNQPHNMVRQVADVVKDDEGVTAFYACRCGHRWITSYLISHEDSR